MSVAQVKKQYHNYAFPGRPENAPNKVAYSDLDRFFKCPECEDGMLSDVTYFCPKCKYSATIYYTENDVLHIDYEETKEERAKLKRVNPWTGEYYDIV